MKHFVDKVVWITGASSGIGLQLARRLNEQGAKVILSARNKEALERVWRDLEQPQIALVLPLDVEDSGAFPSKTAEAIAHFGRIDFLFLVAGVSQRAYTRNTEVAVDRRLMEINYFGPVAHTKAVLPYMLKQKSGHIAVMSSIAGKFGFFERSAYSASKAALHGFFESLRLEEAPNGIDITLFAPGPVNTNISHHALNAAGNPTGASDAMLEQGMSVEECANRILAGVKANKKEVIFGKGSEKLGVYLKTLFPELFYKLLSRKRPVNTTR